MFRVGQEVVCVNNSPGKWGFSNRLHKGKIYTVSEVSGHARFLVGPDEIGDGLGLRVLECSLPDDCAWLDARRFRPVVKRKTDISIFTRMLDQTKVHAQ